MKCQVRFYCLLPAIATLGLAVHIARAEQKQVKIREASGIARLGNKLIIVCDEEKGTYFEYRFDDLLDSSNSLVLEDEIHDSERPDEERRITERRLIDSELPIDLEGVAVLGDGTVIALSERLRSLVTRKRCPKCPTCPAEYGSQHSEYAGRGLEGLAVRADQSNPDVFEVAVVWEGGYPARKKRPNGVRQADVGRALSPVIIHHTINLSPTAEKSSGKHKVVTLDMARLNGRIDLARPKGIEPGAYRFRAPDLVWHKDGFIVLLSSERSPEGVKIPKKPWSERFGSVLLQRFDLNGEPIGKPMDLEEKLDAAGAPEEMNWEGLAWFEKGKKLILIFDDKELPPTVAIVEIPPDWR